MMKSLLHACHHDDDHKDHAHGDDNNANDNDDDEWWQWPWWCHRDEDDDEDDATDDGDYDYGNAAGDVVASLMSSAISYWISRLCWDTRMVILNRVIQTSWADFYGLFL